jgi:hypothetical protein
MTTMDYLPFVTLLQFNLKYVVSLELMSSNARNEGHSSNWNSGMKKASITPGRQIIMPILFS